MPERATVAPHYLDPEWQKQMAVHLDFNAMLAPIAGKNYGIDPERLWGLQERVLDVHSQITNRTGKGAAYLGFLDLPQMAQESLSEIQRQADRVAALGDRHVVLGIGGSYLGARAIVEALGHPFRNELHRRERQDRPRLYWEGNGLDSDTIHALLELLPTERPDTIDDAFTLNVISKSGTTLETAVAFRVFQQRAKEVFGPDHAEYVIATTDESKGTLRAIADAEGYATFVIPDDVGGRYSVLTPVGLLPAAVAGVDIAELVAGARAMAERCSDPDLRRNPAYLYAALQYLAYQAGRTVSIMASWTKRLEFFGFWYDQLSSESLGKDGQGRVPITAVNTRDLHARGQQIQEGPHNMVVTNLWVLEPEHDLRFPEDPANLDNLNYLAGTRFSTMLKGAIEGTNYAYARDQRPTMNLLLPRLNAFTLGQLFYLFELATVTEGYLMGINPLDQPGVEHYKKFMFAILGRADMAEHLAEFERRTTASQDYVV